MTGNALQMSFPGRNFGALELFWVDTVGDHQVSDRITRRGTDKRTKITTRNDTGLTQETGNRIPTLLGGHNQGTAGNGLLITAQMGTDKRTKWRRETFKTRITPQMEENEGSFDRGKKNGTIMENFAHRN